MTHDLIPFPAAASVPVPLFAPTSKAAKRVYEFFTTQINNEHTHKAYMNATQRFAQWCEARPTQASRPRLGNHTLHVTGMTTWLKNKGTLEAAQQIANRESPRTSKLHYRRQDEIPLDEVEKISI